MSTEQNNQGKDAKKVLAAFDVNVKKLTAILTGPENLTTVKKVKKDDMNSLVAELFKEDTAATEQEVKDGLRTTLKAYVSLKQGLAEERKKLDNIEVQKKKEFNTAVSKLFAKIEGVDDILKEYTNAFTESVSAVEEVIEETDLDEVEE